MDIAAFITRNWVMISQHPDLFIVWTIVIAGTMYGLARLNFSDRLESLRGRLDLKEAEAADYQRKLGGASPDEAAARVAALEARIAALEPHGLSPAQANAMVRILEASPDKILIMRNMASFKLAKLYEDLVSVFIRAHWAVDHRVILDILAGEVQSGLLVQAGAETANARDLVIQSLRAAKLPFDHEARHFMEGGKATAMIFVTEPSMPIEAS